MFYIANLIILCGYSYLTSKFKSKNQWTRIFLFISWIHFVLLMGLRKNTVGTDSNTYINLFNAIIEGSPTTLNEKSVLFTAIMQLSGRVFGSNYQVYFFVTGVFIISFFWMGFYKSGLNVRKSIILYYVMFFLTSLNITRTFMAVSMIFCGYFFVSNSKKLWKRMIGFVIVIAAILVHSTALIGIPIILTACINFGKKRIRHTILIISLIALFGYRLLLQLFLRMFPVYSNTLDVVDDTVGASAIVFQAGIVFTFLLSLHISKRKIYIFGILRKPTFYSLLFLLAIEIAFYIFGGSFWFFQRIILYLSVFSIPLYANNTKIKNRYNQIYNLFFIVIIGFVFAYRIYANLGDIMPFQFFWQ